MHVLIIEDDRQLAELIARVLKREGMHADIAHDGDTGLEMALSNTYDVAIVDWMLPMRDGRAICLAVRRARVRLPILMLTARGQVEDRVLGLDSGADDYLTKPFAMEELLARVRALARRYDISSPDGSILHCGELTMNLTEHTLRYGDVTVELTPTEWELMEYLMRNCNQVLSREQILNRVWAYERDVQPKMVDIYISYLRRKLQVRPDSRDPIETVRGLGYRLVP